MRRVASGGAPGGGRGGRWVALGSAGLAAVLAAVLAVRLFVPGGPPPPPTSTQAVPTGQPGQAQSPAQAADVGFRSEVAVPESRGPFPLGYVTVAFDKEFPPYAPVVLLYQEKLAEKRGLGVRFVPFDIEDQNRISEQRRAELLQSGGFDVLLTTMNSYALWGGPQTGKVTAIVGESAGADKAIVQGAGIRTFNDLRGKAVAYSDSSVSEYLLYYMLRVGGVPVGEVTRFGQENLNQAARRYLSREAHGVVGWTSGDMTEVASRPGSTVLMDSDQFRVTMDVVVSGSKSLETRREALQAFHEAWFEATRMTIEQPDRAAQAMTRWSNRWTGVGSPQDLRDSLEEFAQATVQDNQAVMAEGSLPLLYERYKEAQSVWRSGGREPRYPLRDAELSQAFDPAFVRKAATQTALTSTRPPVNPTFHLTARPEVKGLSAEQQQRLTTVAVLGVDQVRFPSGSATLPDEARKDLEEQVIPVLRSTVGTYLRIEGSAGWAGGKGLDESRVNALAFERARAVQSYVLKYGISADRVVLSTVVPRCRECAEADARRDDRAGISLMTT